MDNPQTGPRLSAYPHTFARSATAADSNVSECAGMPVVAPRPFSVPVDFVASAKAYKRSQIKGKIIRLLIAFSLIIVVIAMALGAIGYALNKKYAGRALPYTYIGNISIGGLTQPQIKAVLDERAAEIEVTLLEAGLTRTAPVNTFGATFDTQIASERAITGFNPFSYLTKRDFSVPVEVNERYVDGYLRMYVADMQTDAKNASIVKLKKELTIVPETYGFRTSTSYVTQALQEQLQTLDNPIISLSKATDKPTVTEADLQDDIETARRLIATQVGIKYESSIVRPTEDQKLSWLEIKDIPGSSEVQVQFSQVKIREFVLDLAKKYSTTVEHEQLVTQPDGTTIVKPGKNGATIMNTDEVVAAFYSALMNQQKQDIAFVAAVTDYQKLNPLLVPQEQSTAPNAPQQSATPQTPVDNTTSSAEATQNNPSL